MISERLKELYFKKYDDQMGGLNENELIELDCLNITVDMLEKYLQKLKEDIKEL